MNQFSSDKIFKHLDRVAEWQKTGLSRPVTYELDMTNLCNSKCPFCFGFYGHKNDKSSLSLGDAKDIITQIKEFGGRGITFTGGGDPLCNEATIEAVKYAGKIGLDVGFITNGILLTKDIDDILLKYCTWIRISLDAGTKSIYQLTHGLNGDVYKNVINNIAGLVKRRKQLRSSATIGTGFLTFFEVVEDMENFVKVSLKAGVDYAQFRPLLKKSGEAEINRHSDKIIIQNIERCMKYTNKNFKVLCSIHKYGSMNNGETRRAYGRCHGHNFAAVISANKKMYLCCHVRGIDKYCLGDLKKNSLKDIWQSGRRRSVYENIDFKDCPLLCRCDGFNNILWNICAKSDHVNFL